MLGIRAYQSLAFLIVLLISIWTIGIRNPESKSDDVPETFGVQL
jgi:hypothetical protein